MSHKNYSKFSQKEEPVHRHVTELEENKNTVVEEVVPEITEEQVTEELPVQEETVVELPTEEAQEVEEESVEEVVKITTGIVDANQLNVRAEASKDAGVIIVLEKSTEVNINLNESTEDFYRIETSEGVSGYCMKKFITIK